MSSKPALTIVHVSTPEEARQYVEQGYCAVECSIGGDSVVDSLNMDHHGPLSHLEGVAIRAYRDHFGARRDDPRFVVTGAADADACFCIAALVGDLPHPSRASEVEKAPPHIKNAMTADLTDLATLINQVDTDPIGVRLEETGDGCKLLLWNQMSSQVQDTTAFHAGVDRWRSILGARPIDALLEAVKVQEAARVEEARQAKVQKVSDNVAIVESRAWGFDVWYAEVAPVIVAFVRGEDGNGSGTIGCANTEDAETRFGPGGLKNVFSKLQPSGWGGREAIGGSPRGEKLTFEQVEQAAKVVAELHA